MTTVPLKRRLGERKVGGSMPAKKPPDTTTYSGRLGARLRTLREDRGLTVERVAELMTDYGYDISTPTLYHWENGRRQPSIDALPYLAKALKVRIVDLMPAK